MNHLKRRLIAFTIGLLIGWLLAGWLINKYEYDHRTKIQIPTRRPTPTQSVPTIPVRINNEGTVSWYGQEYCDRYSPSCLTASGEKFDDTLFTCACNNKIPLGTNIKFTYQGKTVVAKCNDRGSFEKAFGRVADLSKATFNALAPLQTGVIKVSYEVL